MPSEGALVAGFLLPDNTLARHLLGWRDGRIVRFDRLHSDAWAGLGRDEVDSESLSPDLAGCAQNEVRVLRDDVLVVPAFQDGHTHVFGVGTSQMRPNLSRARDREEALALLGAWLLDHPGDQPVIGEGWDESDWPDPTPPSRDELDEVTRRPLALRRECGHVAVFNSAALAEVGTDWPDLDPTTGLAKEVLPLSIPRLWPPSDQERAEAARRGQAACFAAGIVAIHEMGDPVTFAAFRRLEESGDLRLRVSHFFHSDHIETVLGQWPEPTDRLRAAGVKFFLDGSFGGRSAWLRNPYPRAAGADPARPEGISMWEDEPFFAAVRRCAQNERGVAVHAIGDAAIDQALRAVEVLDGPRVAGPGLRIEHAEYLAPDLLERAGQLPVALSMQPNFVARWQGAGGLYETALGAERTAGLNPLQSARQTGLSFFGSDSMPLGPLLGIEGAVDHPQESERLGWGEAIESYTSAPSNGVAEPFTRGVLAVGEPADFVLLRRREAQPSDPADRTALEAVSGVSLGPVRDATILHPRSLEVAQTWLEGECVFHQEERS